MRFHQICSLLVAFALSANALLRGQDIERSSSRVARTRLARHLPETYPIDTIKSARRSARKLPSRAADTVHIANFELYDLYTENFKSADTTNNRTISFMFADPNSNTSTICTHDWTQTNTTNNYPTDYVLCDFTNTDNDYFYWKFNSWTSLDAFSIEFAHEFSNPTEYPPPYDVVEYFTQATNFSMPCTSRSTATGVFTACTTPGPIPAVVNAIAN